MIVWERSWPGASGGQSKVRGQISGGCHTALVYLVRNGRRTCEPFQNLVEYAYVRNIHAGN